MKKFRHFKNDLIAEAAFNSKELTKTRSGGTYLSKWVERIEKGEPFDLEKGGKITIDRAFLTQKGEGKKTFVQLASSADADSFFKSGTKFVDVIPATNGKTYKLPDISKGTFTSQGGGTKPRDSAYYEMGICVEYNKSKGMSAKDAMSVAGIDPVKYARYEAHLTEVCSKVVENLPNLGPTLVQTGGGSYNLSSEWPGADNTPKTDIYGGGNYRISVKKAGGSQLASGKRDEAAGIFKSGIAYYDTYETRTLQKKMKSVLGIVEKEFRAFNTDNEVGMIRKNAGDMYIAQRIQSIRRQVRGAKPQDIEKHAKAELMAAGVIGEQGNWTTWFLDGVDVMDSKMVMDFFNTYWNSKGQEKLKEEARLIIEGAISNKNLDKQFKEIFQKDPDFKKWCVYEAATGNYKFSGDTNLKSSEEPIANKILVFDEDGSAYVKPITAAWAKGKAKSVVPTVSFKSSGRSKYTALRLSSESYEHDYSTEFTQDLNDILEEEQLILNDELNEAFEEYNDLLLEMNFRDLAKKAKSMVKTVVSKVRSSIQKFFRNVIKKTLSRLQQLAAEGLRKFMEYIGLEVDGYAVVDVTF